ncbi:MAG: hypothetical protein ACXADY_15980 [Candidatus Hodarchaeales archaeon]|jgi:hypothetical protein
MTISTEELKGESIESYGKLSGHPREWVDRTKNIPKDLYSIDGEALNELQLKWVRHVFNYFRPKVKALEKLATEQNITAIEKLDDVVPILFQHTAYKSYPLSLIEKKRFGLLTKWFDKFTTHDLSGCYDIKAKGIDDWLDQLETNSKLLVVHSSGTTGKLSFLPRSQSEMTNYINGLFMMIELQTGHNYHEKKMPFIAPVFRGGRQLAQRVCSQIGPIIAGSEKDYVTAFNFPMSADFMSLAGRLKAAKAKGELGKLQLIKAMAWNKGELIRMKKAQPKAMEEFFTRITTEYGGKEVFLLGTWNMLVEPALQGIEKGIKNVFAPTSGVLTGGGMKGAVYPDGWYEKTCEFWGFEKIRDAYGMTETTGGGAASCEFNNYHIVPYHVPFVLDPETGNPLPREGTQTGRFGFVDLLTESYWGGFITGDKVTIHWDTCKCGIKGPWLENNIVRYSEEQGGDDKISCAGVHEAHDNLLDFLLENEEDT